MYRISIGGKWRWRTGCGQKDRHRFSGDEHSVGLGWSVTAAAGEAHIHPLARRRGSQSSLRDQHEENRAGRRCWSERVGHEICRLLRSGRGQCMQGCFHDECEEAHGAGEEAGLGQRTSPSHVQVSREFYNHLVIDIDYSDMMICILRRCFPERRRRL